MSIHSIHYKTLDGNEAVSYVAYRINEVCAIYPITPSSPMAEFADQWASEGKTNIWGNIPLIAEMQSEGGAAGAAHGALQTGALTTTFTASQGLMLMIPNMYKIAGELTPCVFHIAARSLAAQGLSIFGDHSDVMAVRNTGFAQLASNSVQEAHDMALIAQAASLASRIPFLHFFDGFRTSHEVNKITLLSDDEIRNMIDDELVRAHRARALNPDQPVMRGTAQNPDIYFQGRETVNTLYQALPEIVEKTLEKFEKLTGRKYQLFEYIGDKEATKIIIIMGSGAETVRETVKYLTKQGEKVGVIQVRLYLPFSLSHFINVLPETVKKIAVLDRSKTPGSNGEPLYQDVVAAFQTLLNQGKISQIPYIIGGRYGLSSKEFTPAMVKAIFDELIKDQPKQFFTIGIIDDVSHTSLTVDNNFIIESEELMQAMFYGLGSDGTVGANKNTIKIIGEETNLYAQAYFVYDSKKSGSQTVSHLRFGKKPIHAPYLLQKANFIGCHQFNFIKKANILENAAENATLLLNTPFDENDIWQELPQVIQNEIIQKNINFYIINASQVARQAGMGQRINTVMQTCFFALSGVLSKEQAIEKIKEYIQKTYGKKGEEVVKKNFAAVDLTLENLFKVDIPDSQSDIQFPAIIPEHAPQFIQDVTAIMMMGKGDSLPVSAIPIDGTYPTGTTKWEKRNVSEYVPVWEPDICIQCGNCSFVCPHGVIRAKFYNQSYLNQAPEYFKSASISARGFPETRYTLQIYLEDCTGCNLCVEVCPAKSIKQSGIKAINMAEKAPILAQEKQNIAFFESIAVNDRGSVDFSSIRGMQFLEPLFEFSGACAGCGETPYVKLLSQLFGDRLIVANATGCSSIYGGNLPTTPWTQNHEGRGPAWSNSLFEDNAEFGFGFRLTADKHLDLARELIKQLEVELGESLVEDILQAKQVTESQIRQQRERIAELKNQLAKLDNSAAAKDLASVIDHLVRRSIWIVGGDGWAYDIGYSGLDHVLASGRDVNILVMDTEVYSNTGGQMSKATPLGAVAKFANAGKTVGKKDLALQAISYGNVYVARIAFGANPQQALLAFREAEAYKGPSIILAYSHCIAHGINMQHGLKQQHLAVASGYWPLVRYNPALHESDKNPFILDSPRPKIALKDYAYNELRYKMLKLTNPSEAERLMELAQQVVNQRWEVYEEMATREAHHFHPDARYEKQASI